jgi:HPt (histidine-containing phosphotransfer) domain-containing protein
MPLVLDVFDFTTFLRSIDGNVRVFRELAELLMADCPRRLACVRDALERQDGEALESAAHMLKGSAGYFCAPSAYAAAVAVEAVAQARDFIRARAACARLEHEVDRLMRALAGQLRNGCSPSHGLLPGE